MSTTFYRRNKMADFNEAIKDAIAKAKAEGLAVNVNFENEIDPLLVRWAKSKWSGALACGFGVALLSIGGVIGSVFF